MRECVRASALAFLHRQSRGKYSGPLERTCQTSLQERRADEKEDISFSNICRDAPPLETAGVQQRVRVRASWRPVAVGVLYLAVR